jgi:hypothetical protein
MTSPEVIRTLPVIFSAVRCRVSTAALFNLSMPLSHRGRDGCTSVPTFCRGCYHSSNSIAPERISYYLLGGGLRRSKLVLDLDLVATKHWLAPTGLLRVPSLLKPSVRQIPSCCLSRGSFPEACVVCWLNVSLYFTSGAFCAPGAVLSFGCCLVNVSESIRLSGCFAWVCESIAFVLAVD